MEKGNGGKVLFCESPVFFGNHTVFSEPEEVFLNAYYELN